MTEPRVIMDAQEVQRALEQIGAALAAQHAPGTDVVLVGIQRGGVPLAQRLSKILARHWGRTVPVGSVDVSMHRDDLNQRPVPAVHPTVIPFDINNRVVVLVDDVLFSARTIRAAMDALNDFGRPKRIQLAVLIDRGHRELPIKADFVGKEIETTIDEIVTVELTEAGAETDRVVITKK
ncbi:MAG: bifunctional pyr operon transcriptional regulator/uracil phosphoribosyltransferase PyrR [Verrucomicrobiae bacterium]|nr:bifunctional pyr operon transcriptional regulator/uracil phosphoribosyltransferase PyrR [Verrucomicrobiae bacterium]